MTGARQAEARAAFRKAIAGERQLLLKGNATLTRAVALDKTEAAAKQTRDRTDADLLAMTAQALTEGREVDSRKVAELEGIAKRADREARAAKAAAAKLRADAAAIGEAIKAAKAGLTDAALEAVRGIRDEGAEAVVDGLARLVASLAAVLASDEVRRALVGEHYTFTVAAHPLADLWSGAAAVRKLIDNLPPQLAPEGFKAAVEAAARQIAADALAALNRENDDA